jgi:hypothetical protein
MAVNCLLRLYKLHLAAIMRLYVSHGLLVSMHFEHVYVIPNVHGGVELLSSFPYPAIARHCTRLII